ncbi:hypothetical protein MUK42_04173 [Musa troglodytarum]|uniref:Uncharacterized protein n=1 Tax=Musa troglodytarum TaxID=320322 RepID=A0A9E7GHG7_9LILI|nr:hypothetical protein MUK42_04173 [Musa troglodytarum]
MSRRRHSRGTGRRAMRPRSLGRGSSLERVTRRKWNRGSGRFAGPTKTMGVGFLGSTSTGRPKNSSTESTRR